MLGTVHVGDRVTLFVLKDGYQQHVEGDALVVTPGDQILAIALTPRPFEPPFHAAPRVWKGNLCGVRVLGLPPVLGGAADPSLVLSWFYDRYRPDDRARIRAAWKMRGYLDVALSWPDSRSMGATPDDFLATCRELRRDGFRPCPMLCSKDFDSADVTLILASVHELVTKLVASKAVSRVCIGWELSLWLSPTQVQDLIDRLAPVFVAYGCKVYVHFQQGYLSFPQPDHDNASFWWKQVGKLTGVLHQRSLDWDQPMYQARLVDCLQRFAGQFNMPADSGFGHPFDLVAFEITASPQFDGSMTEADGDAWGRVALDTPGVNGPFGLVMVMGSGNGE